MYKKMQIVTCHDWKMKVYLKIYVRMRISIRRKNILVRQKLAINKRFMSTGVMMREI